MNLTEINKIVPQCCAASIININDCLELEGFKAKIVPYPRVSGVRFKKLADKTNLGEIGDNNLFLHKDWGPWVHLRILLTDAEIYSDVSE